MLWTPSPRDGSAAPDPRWAAIAGPLGRDGSITPIDRADLATVADAWSLGDEVPEPISELLRVSRQLFVNAWWAYEFLTVAVVWSLFAVEAALRQRLPMVDHRTGMRGLVRNAGQLGLLDADFCDRLDAAAQLRNRLAHATDQTVFSPGMAETFLAVSHASVTAIFRTPDVPASSGRHLWLAMNSQPRVPAASASRRSFPERPGVYAWYRDGTAIYVGKATNLRTRVGGAHLSTSADLTKSALRRNVAEHLGIARAADIRAQRTRLDAEAAARVLGWLLECEIAWIECHSGEAAADLETRMKREWRPMLTRR